MKLINGSIWAMHPGYLPHFEEIDLQITDEKIAELEEAAKRPTSFKNVGGNVAVIPIQGPIFNRDTWLSRWLGSSNETIGGMLDAAVADPSIGAVVFDVDSPGGTVEGTQELTEKIYRSRGAKPIISVVNGWMASAAYHIGSAADEIIASPSSQVGSIGVLMVHAEESKALEMAGIKYTIIKAGEYKVEANPIEPLNDDARDYLQSQVDSIYEDFLKDVGRNRGVKATQVKADYGKGRMLTAKNALAVGMIDRVATMDKVLTAMVKPVNKRTARNSRAKLRLRAAALTISDRQVR